MWDNLGYNKRGILLSDTVYEDEMNNITDKMVIITKVTRFNDITLPVGAIYNIARYQPPRVTVNVIYVKPSHGNMSYPVTIGDNAEYYNASYFKGGYRG